MSAWETSHDEFELALEPPKQQKRLADQADPWTALEAIKMDTPLGAAFLADKAIDVLNDQAGRSALETYRRKRIRDQERAPIAADLKRSMREKAQNGLKTLALTADDSEAHRQVPIDERDWHPPSCQVRQGR